MDSIHPLGYLYLWVGGLQAGLITGLNVDVLTTVPVQLSTVIAHDNLVPGYRRRLRTRAMSPVWGGTQAWCIGAQAGGHNRSENVHLE